MKNDRTEDLHFRTTPEEKEQIRRKAEKAGLSMSDYLVRFIQVQSSICFEHDAKTGKPLLDEQGRMIARKGILKDTLNCDFDSFAAECMETNNLYHKNKGVADNKSHDYILSFDPKDDITAMEAMELAKKYTEKFLEGHQVIIVVHPDGHNGRQIKINYESILTQYFLMQLL